MATHLLRLLEALGATSSAAALVGPAQVGTRLIEFSFLRRVSPLISARIATALHSILLYCFETLIDRRLAPICPDPEDLAHLVICTRLA